MAGSQIGTTLTHKILLEERAHAKRTGESPTGVFSELLNQLAVAGKIISAEVNMAGLADILGLAGRTNIQGEEVMKLDLFADRTIIELLRRSGHVCIMASEEIETSIDVPPPHLPGEYAVAFDPLDGSSNIDVNVSIGTIFSIHRRRSPAGSIGDDSDLLRRGSELAGAGYIIYGSSTMLVYSTGHGVHGFTLDPSVGEFLLSHEDIRIPEKCGTYSVNEGNSASWSEGTRGFVEHVKNKGDDALSGMKSRYIGSLVADFHRNLLKGGVFLYPADQATGKGKLRLLYEASPLAFIARAAGGYASTGKQAILDIDPDDLHQRVPLIIGNTEAVEKYESAVAGEEVSPTRARGIGIDSA
jgi:fructose-1,6-bisphosphatase I